MDSTYKCPNCNIIMPSSEESSHLETCKSDPFNLFTEVENSHTIQNMYFNKNNANFIPQNFDTKIQKAKYDTPQLIDNPNVENHGIYICALCGQSMEYKFKKDHMFCHKLQNEENITLENDIAIHNYFNKNDENAFEDEEEDTSKYFDEFSKKQIHTEKEEGSFVMTKWEDKNKNIKTEALFYDNNKLTLKKIIINDKNGKETYSNIINNPKNDSDDNESGEEEMQYLFLPPEEGIPGMRYIIINPQQLKFKEEKSKNKYPEMELEDIDKIPKEKRSCNICLREFEKKDKLMLLPCIHYFHSQCLKEWLKDKNVCPLCKLDLSKEFNTETGDN